MKTSSRSPIAFFAVVIGGLLVWTIFARDSGSTNREPHFYSKVPWAVGFGMEGTVTNVSVKDGRIQFQVNGRFWISQYPLESTKQVYIEVHRDDGFSATVTPGGFVAMTTDCAVVRCRMTRDGCWKS